MKKKPVIETCVDCGNGTYHHLGGRVDGVPICNVCEYKRQLAAGRKVGDRAVGVEE
jgi:formylmethanofuran dehydrogenase subunit E